MIIKVDGWLYELSDETAFIEFDSSYDNGIAGTWQNFNKHSEKIKSSDNKSLGLPEDVHGTKRIKNTL